MKIEIQYQDLNYILGAAKKQIRKWYEEYKENADEIYLNKIESIIDEINESPAMIFELKEGAE